MIVGKREPHQTPTDRSCTKLLVRLIYFHQTETWILGLTDLCIIVSIQTNAQFLVLTNGAILDFDVGVTEVVGTVVQGLVLSPHSKKVPGLIFGLQNLSVWSMQVLPVSAWGSLHVLQLLHTVQKQVKLVKFTGYSKLPIYVNVWMVACLYLTLNRRSNRIWSDGWLMSSSEWHLGIFFLHQIERTISVSHKTVGRWSPLRRFAFLTVVTNFAHRETHCCQVCQSPAGLGPQTVPALPLP